MQNTLTESQHTSYGVCYHLRFTLCNHTFEWKIDHHMKGKTSDERLNETYDVIPILPTFYGIDYDPYIACCDVMTLLSATGAQPSSRIAYNDIVKVLTDSIVNDQRQKVKILTKSFR
jgi:hypothetical protein